jgi:hypothetical protein
MMNEFDEVSNDASVFERLIKEILDLSEEQRSSLLRQLEGKAADRSRQGQRGSSRKTYSNYIKFIAGDSSCWGHCRDISEKGMFIETAEKLSVGDALTLNLPNAPHNKIIKAPAKVMRITTDGIGVVFS